MSRRKPQLAMNFQRRQYSIPEEDVAKEILHVLCTYGGSMSVSAIVEAIGPGKVNEYFGGSRPEVLLGKYPKIFMLDIQQHRTQVTAKSTVKACDAYCTKNGCPEGFCQNLHICKHYAIGTCKFAGNSGGGQRKCFHSHDFHDDHNMGILSQYLLDSLSSSQIQNILKESWKSLSVPGICKFYNKGEAGCGKGAKCPFLHVCEHYVSGDCAFTNARKQECKRSHNILDLQPKALLEKYKVDVQRSPKEILQDIREASSSWKGDKGAGPSSPTAKAPVDTSSRIDRILDGETDICPYYVRGKCDYRGACVRHHCDMPYLWQRKGRGGDVWISYERTLNEKIEKAYCDASRDDVTVFDSNQVEWKISFDEQMATNLNTNDATYRVRRLSTWSSVNTTSKQLFATTWCWYWQDEYNQWYKYGEKSGEASSTVNSLHIEQQYSNVADTGGSHQLSFRAGRHAYTLSFADMTQQNDNYRTERKVRRRPKFMSEKNVDEQSRRKPHVVAGTAAMSLEGSKSEFPTPDHWDGASDDYGDYQLVEITRGMTEYDDLVDKITKTLPIRRVIRIARVQNLELWDLFSRKKKWMAKKRSDTPPEEKHLFHGTKNEFVDAICQQNFDFRLSGTRVGKKYGMGSYFARDAKYSHHYTESDNDGIRHLFVARVLVGSYAQGLETYRKPPPKDPNRPLGEIYDSCVNNVTAPKIFVIFDNSQTYPEYIISYQ